MMTFPYLVIRLMPAVYLRRQIVFDPRACHFTLDRKEFSVVHRGGTGRDLTEGSMAALLDEVRAFAARSRFRCAVVFSEECTCYIEASGKEVWSGSKPLGGDAGQILSQDE